MKRRTSRGFLTFSAVLIALGVSFTGTIRAGDNLDFLSDGHIRDMFWDSRLYDGTPGFPGAILWHHDPTGMPSGLNRTEFEARLEAGFNAWDAVDANIPGAPLVPVVNFGGQTSVTDPFALDGINAVTWRADTAGGNLASTPCWVLTAPTTTINDGAGNTVMPVSGGPPIPFPGPIGVTYPAGAIIDCGMRFDSADTWSTSDVPSPFAFDVQSVGTHEGGHFIGISHSTMGDFTAASPLSATMIPVGASGDTSLRTLEEDDKASVLRTYARNRAGGPIAQTAGGRGTIEFTLLKGVACQPATGLSVVAYRTSGGIAGANRVETFSGSHLRAGILDEPFNGSVTLNVPPLPAGESYTIYARTFEQGQGVFSGQRYNFTTINSNLLDALNGSRIFDQLATIGALGSGQALDLGSIGILGCWVPDPASAIDLIAESVTAPASAVVGSQITVTSGFRNQGAAPSGPLEVGIYLSTDQTINSDDLFTGFSCSVANLSPGATGTCNGLVDVPDLAPGNYFVGLLLDSQNQLIESIENNNGLAAANVTAIGSNPLQPIVNGSFETGDLTGWTVKELTPASNPNLPISVGGAGVDYPATTFLAWPYFLYLDFFTSAPTDGQWAVLHDFNGNDTATSDLVNRRELYQDVTLPPGTTTLEFDYRAAWELFRYGSTRDRTFDVEIEPAGGGPTLLDQTILFALNGGYEEDTDNPSGGTGSYPPGRVDLSAFSNQSIRLKFVWNIPEPGTGFGFFQLDNIRLNTAANNAPVVTITAPADGLTVTAGTSIAFAATASDDEDGNISASLAWSSSLDGAIGSGGSFSTSALSVGAHTITASVTDSGLATGADSISVTINPVPNDPPTVTITAPADGSTFVVGSSVGFTGNASDIQDGNISGSLAWSSSLDGAIGSGGSFSTSALSVGAHTITATVTDSGLATGAASISLTINPIPNDPPTVTITAPADGSTFVVGSSVSFTGNASDIQDGNISGSLAWSSSLDGAIGSGGSFSTSTLSVGTHTITASVTDSELANGADSISVTVNPGPNDDVDNHATADFSTTRGTVAGGTFEDTWAEDDQYEILTEEALGGGSASRRRSLLEHTWAFSVVAGGQYVFKASAYHSGTEDDFAFSYSRDNVAFTPMLIVSATADNDLEQTYVFPADVSGIIYVRVQDTDSTRGNAQLDSLFVDRLVITTRPEGSTITPPVVSIASPSNGSNFLAGATVSFTGSASDAEDGDLGTDLVWTSSIDGVIGSGPAFSTTTLSIGVHSVTASVTDSDGLQSTDSIAVTVTTVGGITLSAVGSKVKGVQQTALTWSGAAPGVNINILRNGQPIATVPNSGAYTDVIGSKGAGSYSYQVCESGGACSNVEIVTF